MSSHDLALRLVRLLQPRATQGSASRKRYSRPLLQRLSGRGAPCLSGGIKLMEFQQPNSLNPRSDHDIGVAAGCLRCVRAAEQQHTSQRLGEARGHHRLQSRGAVRSVLYRLSGTVTIGDSPLPGELS